MERTYSPELSINLQQMTLPAVGKTLPPHLNKQAQRDAVFASALLMLARRLDLGVRLAPGFNPVNGGVVQVGNTGGVTGPVGNTGGISGP
jgi:hypothetical protein